MDESLKAGDSGTIRRVLWDGGSTARVERCPKDSGKDVNSNVCLNCIYYGGFFDDQNRAMNVPQVAIGAGRVRRSVNLICNTTIEALNAAVKTDETRNERDLRTQRETAERKKWDARAEKNKATREANKEASDNENVEPMDTEPVAVGASGEDLVI